MKQILQTVYVRQKVGNFYWNLNKGIINHLPELS
jgi:hypothetical protein